MGTALTTGNNANTHTTKVVQKKLPAMNNYTGIQNTKTPVALKKNSNSNSNQIKTENNNASKAKTQITNHSYHPSYLNYK